MAAIRWAEYEARQHQLDRLTFLFCLPAIARIYWLTPDQLPASLFRIGSVA